MQENGCVYVLNSIDLTELLANLFLFAHVEGESLWRKLRLSLRNVITSVDKFIVYECAKPHKPKLLCRELA